MLRPLLFVGGLLLAGCATSPAIVAGLPERSAIKDFAVEARFALRRERPHAAPESASGRLSWRHSGGNDRILVADPFGQGIAEVDRWTEGARLRTRDGQLREAGDAAALLAQGTGYLLPIADLPAWLLGRPGPGGRLEKDAGGRPLRLSEAGWQIDYAYDDAADALPARLTLRRGDELELRLRIEEWRNLP